MKEIAARIKRLLEDRSASINAFAGLVGIDQSNLNKKLSCNMKISKQDLVLISHSIGVNLEWLTDGVGEPYTEEGKQMLARDIARDTVKRRLLNKDSAVVEKPFYDVDFALGYDGMYNDTPNVPTKTISIPGYEKADFWCRASGDSMKPYINNGDVIALKAVEDWSSFLPMNEVYAIITTNDLRTVKMVRKGSDEEHFTLHAYNEDFEDQEIAKEAILKVFKVIGSLKVF